MATTTPNFGWDIPQSTDLVKDGATAIAALGNDIDTSMVDLKGGTTGQVLSKASNTDMDFTWVAQDDSNAIQNTIVAAKGDIIGASANDTPAVTSVGANGYTLVADSSQTTGLNWQQPKSQNAIYNSGFDIAQRGTSFTALSGADYTLDRWNLWSTTASQSNYVSQQSAGNLSVTPNQAVRYCGRFGRTSGTTNTGARQLFQTLETADSLRFAGKTVTLSFYARAGANYSATSNALDFYISSGTGTDQIYYSFTGSATVANSTATLTTSWQRFSVTGTVATNATELAVRFVFTPTGTAGTNDYFEITGVQLEEAAVATPYARMSGTIQNELAACQRYYCRFGAKNGQTVGTNATYGYGFITAATGANYTMNFPVTMRTSPSSIEWSSLIAYDSSLAQYTPSAVAIVTGQTGLDAGNVQFTISGATAGRAAVIIQNSTSGYLAFSAEL